MLAVSKDDTATGAEHKALTLYELRFELNLYFPSTVTVNLASELNVLLWCHRFKEKTFMTLYSCLRKQNLPWCGGGVSI